MLGVCTTLLLVSSFILCWYMYYNMGASSICIFKQNVLVETLLSSSILNLFLRPCPLFAWHRPEGTWDSPRRDRWSDQVSWPLSMILVLCSDIVSWPACLSIAAS